MLKRTFRKLLGKRHARLLQRRDARVHRAGRVDQHHDVGAGDRGKLLAKRARKQPAAIPERDLDRLPGLKTPGPRAIDVAGGQKLVDHIGRRITRGAAAMHAARRHDAVLDLQPAGIHWILLDGDLVDDRAAAHRSAIDRREDQREENHADRKRDDEILVAAADLSRLRSASGGATPASRRWRACRREAAGAGRKTRRRGDAETRRAGRGAARESGDAATEDSICVSPCLCVSVSPCLPTGGGGGATGSARLHSDGLVVLWPNVLMAPSEETDPRCCVPIVSFQRSTGKRQLAPLSRRKQPTTSTTLFGGRGAGGEGWSNCKGARLVSLRADDEV